MEGKMKFYRNFLIFNQEDAGFGGSQPPSGYVKVEARDRKGKLILLVQNLKEDKNRLSYKAYIMIISDNKVTPVHVGTIPLQRSKGEIQWEFDAFDVAGTGAAIEKFNAAVVIAEYQDRSGGGILCPLAAYKEKKIQWRELLKERFYPAVSHEKEVRSEDEAAVSEKQKPNALPVENTFEKPEENLQTMVEEVKDEEEAKEEAKEEVKEEVKDEEEGLELLKKADLFSKYEDGLESKYLKTDEQTEPDMPELQVSGTDEEDVSNRKDTVLEPGNTGNAEPGMPEAERGEQASVRQKEEESVQGGILGNSLANGMFSGYDEYKEYMDRIIEKDMEANIDETACPALSKGSDPSNETGKNANPCLNCPVHDTRTEAARPSQPAGDNIENLKNSLDKYFEVHDPFGSRRRDYKWWKVSSPVQLNNILYHCNIKTPLLFNPSVMMAHFKYRYLSVGIYTDRIRRKEYIVCGIPGVYGIDDKPFGDFCRWVQLEGNKPKYGAYGYWLVYIDPKSGKFLSLN